MTKYLADCRFIISIIIIIIIIAVVFLQLLCFLCLQSFFIFPCFICGHFCCFPVVGFITLVEHFNKLFAFNCCSCFEQNKSLAPKVFTRPCALSSGDLQLHYGGQLT
jgi:hypothetical protein